MKVLRDDPGRVLLVEGQDPMVPALLAGLVGGLLAMTGQGESDLLWRPSRVKADRDAATLEIVEKNVASGLERSETIRTGNVAGLTVGKNHWRAPQTVGRSTTGPPEIAMDVKIRFDDSPDPAQRSLWFRVDGIDTNAEIADFAYRLGAAIGLTHQRVVRSDPRRIEIDMARAGGTGAAPIPALESADYDRDVVSPGAARAAAAEIVPPFDPPRLDGDHRVAVWLPGSEVRFERPLDRMAPGCFPFVLAGLAAGPAVFMFTHDATITAVFAAIGLLLGAMALVAVVRSLPRRVTIGGRDQAITVGGWFSTARIPLDRLAALEARCRRVYNSRRNGPSYHEYWCELVAHARDEGRPKTRAVVLLSTKMSRDKEAPYDAVLPLATELARSLGVERRVTDYN